MDFIIADGRDVIPLECKSGYSGTHISLDRFMRKYRNRVRTGVVVHAGDIRVDGSLIYIPIYMTMFLGGHLPKARRSWSHLNCDAMGIILSVFPMEGSCPSSSPGTPRSV